VKLFGDKQIKYNVPRLCLLTKWTSLEPIFGNGKSIEDRLGANPAIMVLPIGSEQTYKGNVDLLTQPH